MIEEIEEEIEVPVNIRRVWASIGWIILLIVAFCFFEAMCLEFMSFDEFCVSTMLFVIALQLSRFR